MGPGEWIALAAAVVTVLGGLLALWFRAGRILERIEHISSGHDKHGSRLDDQERRLTRAELIIDRLQ